VRILSENNNWCQVDILEHARPKADPSFLDRGWVNRKYLRFD